MSFLQACPFAASDEPGTLVGLTDPEGAGIPTAAHLVIGGDKTACPALARIIAAQPPATRIEAFLFGARDDYRLPCHPCLTLRPMTRPRGSCLPPLDPVGAFCFATEKSKLQPLKLALLGRRGVPRSSAHPVAYWSDSRTT